MLEPLSVLLGEGVSEQYDLRYSYNLSSILKTPKGIRRQILRFIPILFGELIKVIYINTVPGSLLVFNTQSLSLRLRFFCHSTKSNCYCNIYMGDRLGLLQAGGVNNIEE